MEVLPMKKVIIIILSILLLLLVVSCTKDEKLTTEPELVAFYNVSYADSTLTWKTDLSSRSIIQYSTDSNFLNHTAYSIVAETTNHSIKFLDLTSSTTYYYRIKHKRDDTVSYSNVWKFNSGTVTPSTDLLKIIYIDVKQGDSALIITPSGENIIIDGGYGSYGYDTWAGGGQTLTLNYLNSEGITHIHHMILSHPHTDHIGGLSDILAAGGGNTFTVDNIYDNMLSSTSSAYIDFLSGVNDHTEANYIFPALGSTISLSGGDFVMKLIHSKDNMSSTETGHYYNDCSLTYHLVYKDFTAIFSGDAETVSIDKMIEYYPNDLRSTVYKVGHHGSYNGTSRAFLSKLKAVTCYIPCGANNPYGHPHDQVLTQLSDYHIDIYRADENGTVKLITDGVNTFIMIREN